MASSSAARLVGRGNLVASARCIGDCWDHAEYERSFRGATMSVDRKVLDRLSGFRGLDDVSPPPGFWSECGGGIAYDGALRLFPFSSNRDLASFGEWNSTNGWRSG